VEYLSLSLSLSLSMARGMGLTALFVVVVLLHQTCNTSADQDQCPPSSCSSIPINISHPFRLTSDPENCGDQRYNLSCENNKTLVLHLHHGRYYIQQINYNNNTIRVVDPGIGLNANEYYSFIPRYSLEYNNFSSGDPYQASDTIMAVYFVKCEKRVNSRYHLNISACFEGGVYSSNRYTYALFQYASAPKYHPAVLELGDLCQVEQIYLISWVDRYYFDDLRKISCTDFRNELLRGFELSWKRDGAYIKELMHARKKIHITLAISN
jgi:hypothetical protein